jgi:tetratricopeptide (TPR) repeat protein/tRNA A-37 threonylcarbamoyl transferase component Bud32
MNEPMSSNVDPLIERQREIFLKALEQPAAADRALYLDGACGDDKALRAEVELLLKHHADGSFLERAAQEPKVPPFSTFLAAALTEKPGDTIGRFKLREKIGEGGCGVVYMAEQEEPVRRRVALKIIKLGMDTRSVIARFEAEWQALAMMDHANIARVLDAGATETGRPYFVMELVGGIKITDYCEKNNLSTRQRLDLFIQVCHAIQHAHQKGVIHRDIKPSNVLVAEQDGVPIPKVIDFGIAKATAEKLTDQTVFTAFEQFLGTPAYMSPEQAQLGGLDVDTRSDIYSLGVLLYELLTGQTPFDAKELLAVGLEAMRKTIREKEPPTPSTRLTQERLAQQAAGSSKSEIVNRKSEIDRDLDWIVMKCLEKDRARRYETANGLAMDIERHLSNEPVVAGPPSRAYRFQKLLRRNKLAFAAAAAVSLSVLVGLGISTWMYLKARTEAAKSYEVATFLKDMLAGVGPSKALGRDTTMLREVLDKTAERVGKELAKEPEVEAELRNALATTYLELGLNKEAKEMAEASLRLARTRVGQKSALAAQALEVIGEAQRELGNYDEAEAAHREALTLRRENFGGDTPQVAASLNGLALTLYRKDKMTEAEPLFRQALAVNQKRFGEQSEEAATSLNNLALCLRGLGSVAEAEAAFRASLDIKRKVLGNEHPQVAVTLNNLASLLQARGNLAGAEAAARESVEIERKLFGTEHQNVAHALSTLGDVLLLQGKLVEAEEAQRAALDMRRKLLGDDHLDVASSLNSLGNVLTHERKLGEAEKAYREALAIVRKQLGDDAMNVATTLNNLALNLENQGKLSQAESTCRQALDIQRKKFGAGHLKVDASIEALVRILREEGKLGEAEAVCRDTVQEIRALHPDDPQLAAALYRLAVQLVAANKYAEAEPFARECVSIRERKLPDDWRTPIARTLLGDDLLKQGKYAEAETNLLSAYDGMKQREAQIPYMNKVFLKKAAEALAQLYEATDRTNQAAQWKKTLEDFDRVQTNKPPVATPATKAKP